MKKLAIFFANCAPFARSRANPVKILDQAILAEKTAEFDFPLCQKSINRKSKAGQLAGSENWCN